MQKIIQTRNLGQFQEGLLSVGIKGILKIVLQDQEKIIHYKVQQDNIFRLTFLYFFPSSKKSDKFSHSRKAVLVSSKNVLVLFHLVRTIFLVHLRAVYYILLVFP